MKTTPPLRKEDVQDPIGKIGWPKDKGRDGERTPMQWNESKNAGFSTANKTWLPVPPTFKQINVADESKRPDSLLNFYRALLRLRHENAILRDGDFKPGEPNPNVLWFLRTSHAGTVLVAMNYSNAAQTMTFEVLSRDGRQAVSEDAARATTLLSTFAKPGAKQDLRHITLPPFGVFIGQLQ